MSISGTQLIYRLQDTVRLLIDYRSGVDTFNFYWSSTEGGAYTSFYEGLINEKSDVPSIRGKIVFDFNPSAISGWNNDQTNWIKLAPVTGGIVGAQEGPLKIMTRLEMIPPKDATVIYGFNSSSQTYIPMAVNEDGELKTA